MNKPKYCFAGALLCAAAPVMAQEQAQEKQPEAIEEIVISAHPLSAEGLATPADALDGEELKRKLADSIGATVAGEPGIHNAPFGAAVGRPVIHGMGGPRVRVMEDRIDTMDVSVSSGDHAVTLDPFIADRIEIFKGPGTLLYGSGAIGGVVDVHTGRIPHRTADEISGKLDLRRANNADAGNASLRLDGGAGSFAWHLDGFRREANDLEIPGFANSALLRAMPTEEHEEEEHEEEEHEDEHEGEEEAFGVLPGSGLDMRGGAAGFSFIGERGFIGVAISNLDAEYGILGHGHGHEEEEHEEEGEHHEEEEGNPFADLKQTRVDFEAALVDPLPGFEHLNLRLGVNDYEHAELEPSGEIGTVFENEAWEARAELTHLPVSGWSGAVGVQFGDRAFSVLGEEAFTQPVDTRSMGLFWVGERSFKKFALEAGLRAENVEHEPETGGDLDFTTFSASLGAIMPLNSTWTAAVLADYSSRAPVGEELFSDGPHFATRSFDIGDPGLGEEQARNLSATLRGQGRGWFFAGTVYHTSFNDFIYQAATGEEIDELLVRQFEQAGASFSGLDLEASLTLARWSGGELRLTGFFDTVEAELDVSGNDRLPLMPPDRIGFGLAVSWGAVSANLDYVRASAQTNTAEHELATEGYDDLRAWLSYAIERDDMLAELFLRGRNLTGDEQRHHTSIVKDMAPAPGRTIEAGLRLTF